MKNIIYIVAILLLLAVKAQGQVYINIGTNLTNIETSHIGRDHNIYGTGYSLGLNYKYDISNTFSIKTGGVFVSRKDIRLDARQYEDYFFKEDDWLKITQNIVCVPIDLRTRFFNKFNFISGIDLNYFLKNSNTKFKNAFDPNFKVGLSYDKDKWLIDIGYTQSIKPYASESIFDFKNKAFFLAFNYRIF